MSERMQTYTHGPVSGGVPKQIVLLLHGVGSNGQDLISLAPYWQNALPDAVFVSPDAPFTFDMAMGMPGAYQWFSLQDWDPKVIRAGIERAMPILNDYIDKTLQHYDLKEENLVLVGFSQGTMMNLYTAPRRGKPIAGILGYSGALFGGEDLTGPDIQKMPVHLVHGEADPVVPVEAWHMAQETLKKAGFEVSGQTSPGLEHGIDNDGIESGTQFLKSIFQGQ